MQEEAELTHKATAPRERSPRRAVADLLHDIRLVRLTATVVLFALGVIFVLLGWYGAAHTNILTEQIPYLISGGLLGLGLIIVAGTMASSLSNEMQTDRMRREIIDALTTRAFTAADTTVAAASTNGHAYYAVAGGVSFHVAGCPILEGKEFKAVSAKAREPLAPCKLCVD